MVRFSETTSARDIMLTNVETLFPASVPRPANPRLRRRLIHIFVSCLVPLLTFCAGCSSNRELVERALQADTGLPDRIETAQSNYLIQYPDMLELTAEVRENWTGKQTMGADGRIDLGSLGRLRVEGQTVKQVEARIADVAGLPRQGIRTRVAEFNSQQIHLFGQVKGLRRAVPYQGPERILDVLQRAGGLTAGAAPDDVYVIRSRIGEGQQPEVFRIDLQAIILRNDGKSNIYVQPLDQIHVGESRQFTFEKCIPPWLRPVYEALVGIRTPPEDVRAKAKQSEKGSI